MSKNYWTGNEPKQTEPPMMQYVYSFSLLLVFSSQCRSPSLNHFVPRFPNREEEDSTKFMVFKKFTKKVSFHKFLPKIKIVTTKISVTKKLEKLEMRHFW